MLTKAINVVRLVVNPTTLEYKIYVSAFSRYHQNKYQIHKCDIAIIIGEGELFNNRITADILITSAPAVCYHECRLIRHHAATSRMSL